MRKPGFLAFSIEAQLNLDGQLLSADPHLARLHLANGGTDGGKLAIPALLYLAQLCARTGSTLERPVRAADGERDLLLWAKATRNGEVVTLSITGWQEQGVQAFNAPNAQHLSPALPSDAPRADIILDRRGYVIRAAPWLLQQLGCDMVGRDLIRFFERTDGLNDKIWECGQKPVSVRARSSGRIYAVTAAPLRSADEELTGYGIVLADIAAAEMPIVPAAGAKSIGFGKNFASAVRQPLSRIIANAETIKTNAAGRLQDNYIAYAQDISAAATHLNELISDLEDLDAIDRQDFRVASEKVELGDIARRVAGLLALKAADHHIHLILPDPDERVEVQGEFRRVLQITLNLVGNAIRYAPGGSNVHIKLQAVPPSISVCDEGKGVPVDDRERIFVKFERLGRSGDGGSGLGLYISRRLAGAMKGEIEVGEAPEGGAMFTLRLPAYRKV